MSWVESSEPSSSKIRWIARPSEPGWPGLVTVPNTSSLPSPPLYTVLVKRSRLCLGPGGRHAGVAGGHGSVSSSGSRSWNRNSRGSNVWRSGNTGAA